MQWCESCFLEGFLKFWGEKERVSAGRRAPMEEMKKKNGR
jgi:hypothetical protein